MANPDAPFGLAFVRTLSGVSTSAANHHPIASGYATDLHYGDLVSLSADGTIIKTPVAANVQIIGVFQGVERTDGDGEPVFSKKWTGGTVAADARALVLDDPNAVFQIQCDGTFANAQVGNNVNITAGGGNDATGLSTMEADISTAAVGANKLRIIRAFDAIDNEIGDFTRIEVVIQQHHFKSDVGV